MKLEEIYNGILNNKDQEKCLNYLLSNITNYTNRLNNILTLQNIFKILAKENSKYLNELLQVLRKSPNRVLHRVLLYLWDKKFRNEKNLNKIIDFFESFPNLPIFNELIKDFLPLLEEFDRDRIYMAYSDQVFNYCFEMDEEENEKIIPDRFSDINFDYISDSDFEYIFNSFFEYEEFMILLKKYFHTHPDRILCFSLENFIKAKEISKNVRFYAFKYEDLSYLDNKLKNDLGYSSGLDFSFESIKAIVKYYSKTGDKNIVPELITVLKRRLPSTYLIDFQELEENQTLDFTEEKEGIDYLLKEYENSQRKDIKIIISPKKAEEHYELLKTLSTDLKVFIEYKSTDGEGRITFEEYKKAHLFYDGIAEYIDRFYLSPLEKYLFAFYLTTIFKKYNYYKSDKDLDQEYGDMSRDPYFIIKHNYIVCAGYTNFLLQILNRLNISATFLTSTPKESGGYHARVLIYLVDKKYDIDGVYIGDPTVGTLNTALQTRNKKTYEDYKYTDPETTRYFNQALSELYLTENYLKRETEDFYDIINRKIPDTIIVNAVRNIMNKIYPYLTDEQIEEKVAKIIGQSQIVYAYPYYDISKTIYESVNNNEKYSFEAFIEPAIMKNVEFKWFSGGYSKTDCKNSYLITDKHRTDDELGRILLANKLQIENEYIEIGYSNYHEHYYINVKVPSDFTMEQFKDIFLEGVISVYSVLGYKLKKPKQENQSSEISIVSQFRI